jgi:uncharacterized protein (TIGR03083 family)
MSRPQPEAGRRGPGTGSPDGLPAAIAAERRDLADVLAGLSPEAWEQPSLCTGWRVREVVAHMTIPFRYSTARFALEMARPRPPCLRAARKISRACL